MHFRLKIPAVLLQAGSLWMYFPLGDTNRRDRFTYEK
jgi:hypothetical protein